MGLEKWSKLPALAARHFCGVFLQKNGSLHERKDQRLFFFYDSLAGLFSGLSCYCKTVARRQSLIEFQNSIIYHFQFN